MHMPGSGQGVVDGIATGGCDHDDAVFGGELQGDTIEPGVFPTLVVDDVSSVDEVKPGLAQSFDNHVAVYPWDSKVENQRGTRRSGGVPSPPMFVKRGQFLNRASVPGQMSGKIDGLSRFCGRAEGIWVPFSKGMASLIDLATRAGGHRYKSLLMHSFWEVLASVMRPKGPELCSAGALRPRKTTPINTS
jgi:hypothetical protein